MSEPSAARYADGPYFRHDWTADPPLMPNLQGRTETDAFPGADRVLQRTAEDRVDRLKRCFSDPILAPSAGSKGTAPSTPRSDGRGNAEGLPDADYAWRAMP